VRPSSHATARAASSSTSAYARFAATVPFIPRQIFSQGFNFGERKGSGKLVIAVAAAVSRARRVWCGGALSHTSRLPPRRRPRSEGGDQCRAVRAPIPLTHDPHEFTRHDVERPVRLDRRWVWRFNQPSETVRPPGRQPTVNARPTTPEARGSLLRRRAIGDEQDRLKASPATHSPFTGRRIDQCRSLGIREHKGYADVLG